MIAQSSRGTICLPNLHASAIFSVHTAFAAEDKRPLCEAQRNIEAGVDKRVDPDLEGGVQRGGASRNRGANGPPKLHPSAIPEFAGIADKQHNRALTKTAAEGEEK